jgi:hypothetical protein
MAPTHIDVVNAIDKVLTIERSFAFPHASFRDRKSRYDWLSEADLMARLRAELVATGACAVETTRIAPNGRTNKATHTNRDIEYAGGAIEGVYCYSKTKSGMPGWTLSGDLTWLLGRLGIGHHVVAFIPRMMSGFRTSGAYSMTGTKLSLAAGDKLLSDLVQVGGLASACWPLLADLFVRMQKPPKGNKVRWSLANPPMALGHLTCDRSVVGKTSDNMWAVVWSRK